MFLYLNIYSLSSVKNSKFYSIHNELQIQISWFLA